METIKKHPLQITRQNNSDKKPKSLDSHIFLLKSPLQVPDGNLLISGVYQNNSDNDGYFSHIESDENLGSCHSGCSSEYNSDGPVFFNSIWWIIGGKQGWTQDAPASRFFQSPIKPPVPVLFIHFNP
jgi:hypothetical protein